MESQTLANPFLNIPRKKLDDAIEEILEHHSNNGVLTTDGAILTEAFNKYYNANIPVDYWWRDMDNWSGPNNLKKYYDEISSNIVSAYKEGKRACLASKNGVGKTLLTSCILKRALETNKYSALYVNLVDIIHIMLNTSSNIKNKSREMLLNVDFLVIDEFDARFMGSDNAADLFGRILEPIMRARIQNRMPLFFCTNSPNVNESFSGPLQASIGSLMNMVKLIPVIGGNDARERIKRGEL